MHIVVIIVFIMQSRLSYLALRSSVRTHKVSLCESVEQIEADNLPLKFSFAIGLSVPLMSESTVNCSDQIKFCPSTSKSNNWI